MAVNPTLVTRFQNFILDVNDRKADHKETIARWVEEDSLDDNSVTVAEVFTEFIALQAMSQNLPKLLPCVEAAADQEAVNVILVCELGRESEGFPAHSTVYACEIEKVSEDGDITQASMIDPRNKGNSLHILRKFRMFNDLVRDYNLSPKIRFYHEYLSDKVYQVAESTNYRVAKEREEHEVHTLAGVFFFTKDMCHHVVLPKTF